MESHLHAFSLHAGMLFQHLFAWLHSLETIIASGPNHVSETLIAQETIIAK